MNRTTNPRPWTLVFLLGLTILILALHETGQLELLEDALSLVIGPLQRALSGTVETVGGTFSSVGDARELRMQLEEMQAVANDLAAQAVRLVEVEAENAQLRELLDFVSANPSLHAYVGGDIIEQSGLVESRVIGQEPNPYIYYVVINRGSHDGLDVGMPALAGGGRLVGRIAEVRPRWSKVQLLIDPGSRVNGMIQASRALGLVTGQPDGSLVLEQVPQSDQVNVGDTVVTSGLSGPEGLIPKGLIVGQVTAVERSDIDLHQTAVLRPAVDLRHLEMVLVITDFEPVALDESAPENNP
jgi:rod shape-determining protein MreC